MSNYLDETYAAIDGTILSYSGQNKELTIPTRLATMPITSIGKGAFMNSDLTNVVIPQEIRSIEELAFAHSSFLKSVTLSPKIEHVGNNAFSDCVNLESVILDGFEISKVQYETIKATSKKIWDSSNQIASFPDNPFLKSIAQTTGFSVAKTMTTNADRLFYWHKIPTNTIMNCPTDSFNFSNEPSVISEEEAVAKMIRSGRFPTLDNTSETKNDMDLKRDLKDQRLSKTAIFCFDDEKTREENGRFFLDITIRFGYFFWQSVLPVMHGKTRCYIYRRHFLEPCNSDKEYLRDEVAVFKEDQLVTSQKEAEEIYAKYRLLTLL